MSTFTLKGVLQGPISSEAHKRDHPEGGKIADHAELYLGDPRLAMIAREIHGSYVNAGANFLVTGTFGATDFRFNARDGKDQLQLRERLQLSDRSKRWNQRAAEIARDVAGESGTVLGSIAPLFNSDGSDTAAYRSLGRTQFTWAVQRHLPQIQALLLAGSRGFNKGEPLLDGIILEAGQNVPEDIAIAKIVSKIRPGAILILSHEVHGPKFSDPDRPDLTLAKLATFIRRHVGDDMHLVLGLNCCAIEDIDARNNAGDTVSVAYPNRMNYAKAGELRLDIEQLNWRMQMAVPHGGSFVLALRDFLTSQLDSSDADFREAAERQLQAGTKIIGGCCGTGPEHTRILREVYDRYSRASGANSEKTS